MELSMGSNSKNTLPRTVRPAAKRTDSVHEKSYSSPETVRFKEQRSGCLGAVMYYLFILCLSIAAAFFLWMAASDVLALNKSSFTTEVTLPAEHFENIEIESESASDDETDSAKKTVSSIDLDYLADTLHNAGLINYKWLFTFYCRLSNAAVKVSPGTYSLKSTYDYRALVQNMRKGTGGMKTVDVTFPEGFTMLEIFTRLDEYGVADYDDLLSASAETTFVYDFLEESSIVGSERLEGFLFPDTYQFYMGTEASTAINKLLNNFNLKYTSDMLLQTANMGYTVRDIVTIASIIESEAKLDEDRAYVASVIYNRLKSGMSLGMDSTVLYLFPEHEGEPDQTILNTDSPYNTHIYGGLPPTPICSPGMASINAALNPAESSYYYFFSDEETGKINFFTNYDEFAYWVQTH